MVIAGSIAYGVPFKFLPAHQYKEGKGSSKFTETSKRKKRCWDGLILFGNKG